MFRFSGLHESLRFLSTAFVGCIALVLIGTGAMLLSATIGPVSVDCAALALALVISTRLYRQSPRLAIAFAVWTTVQVGVTLASWIGPHRGVIAGVISFAAAVTTILTILLLGGALLVLTARTPPPPPREIHHDSQEGVAK